MNSSLTFLVAEDSESDAMLLDRAFRKNNIKNPIQWVKDGQHAIDYLRGVGDYADRASHPFPDLVILDLKMPRVSGMQVLEWMKEHSEFRILPTIVMSSSGLESDVQKAYDLGANTYFVKPADFETLVDLVSRLHGYWTSGVRPAVRKKI